jgi:DNA-binding response OmpR family regulator
VSAPPATPEGAPRVIVCDYNALLQSVTGLLRMSGCAVFQAYDGQAAQQLCQFLPDIDLLILNTLGTGVNTPDLVRTVREVCPGLAVLHIGHERIPGMPADVADLPENFTADELLGTVRSLLVGARAERASH